jgi:outer membrane protein assembly factor BamB
MREKIRTAVMKGVVATFAALIAAGSPSASSQSEPLAAAWPMFHHDRALSGRSEFDTGDNPGQLKWAFKVLLGRRSAFTGAAIYSSPAVGADGTIYFGCDDHNFYALTPDGRLKWKFATDDPITSSPAIGADGTIYFGGNRNFRHEHWLEWLFALNPDGTIKWKFASETDLGKNSISLASAGWIHSPSIGSDGTIYVGSDTGVLFAIHPNGKLKWTLNTGSTDFAPAIGRDGTIYVHTRVVGDLKAVTPDGQLKWKISSGIFSCCSPAIGRDGTIYVGGLNAVNPNGTLKWSFTAHSEYSEFAASSPAIGHDGTIYVGYRNSIFLGYRNYGAPTHLYAVTSGGQLRWSFEKKGGLGSPVVSADGTIYVGSWDNHLYAVNPNGKQKWAFTTDTKVTSAPALGRDGTVYVGCEDGSLYAIGTSSSKPVPHPAQALTVVSAWPMFHHDSAHTGRSQTRPRTNAGALKWKFDGGDSPPVIGNRGTIYVGDSMEIGRGAQEGALDAIGPNGKLKWQLPTDGDVDYFAPAIGNDGTIYIGSNAPALYAVTARGKLKWTMPMGEGPSAPTIGPDGTIYVASDGLYAVYPDGIRKWRFTTGYDTHTSPAIDAHGIAYIGFEDRYLYAVNSDGSQKWAFDTGYTYVSSPAIGGDGTIYVGSSQNVEDAWHPQEDGKLCAIDRNGRLEWTFTIGAPMVSSPAVGADGTIYFHSNDTYLYAVSTSGQLKWKFAMGSDSSSSPAIGSDGTIYIGASDANLYAIKPDGLEAWMFQMDFATSGGFQNYSPAIGTDGTVYINGNGQLYAVGSASSSTTTPSPKPAR